MNAAIEGAVSGGATEIVVNDSHSTMRNLPADAPAAGASCISGSHKPLYMMQGLDGSFDAVLFVSYHWSVGASAGLSHTYSPRVVFEARLGGVVTGEADIAEAASWVRGVERTGPREPRFQGDDPLAVYRSFCAAILLTRTIAEAV